MKAIHLIQPGSADEFEIIETNKPVIKDEEVLIQVKSISINPVDIKTRQGKAMYAKLKDKSPLIIGWDIAGVVTETNSKKFNIGDEVFGMVNFPGHGKAYAEYAAAPAAHLASKPSNISFDEAAAASLAALTAYQDLVHYAAIKQGDRVLVLAASGGVGHYVVQIAKQYGAYVIGTSSAANRDFVLSLGADEHFDYKSGELKDHIRDIDIVFDPVGGETASNALEVMKKGGTILSITSGLDEAGQEKAKAAGIIVHKTMVASNGEDMQVIADLLEEGHIESRIAKVFRFEEMKEAHLQIESGRTVGKVVVHV